MMKSWNSTPACGQEPVQTIEEIEKGPDKPGL
jgi:hypothetical protein